MYHPPPPPPSSLNAHGFLYTSKSFNSRSCHYSCADFQTVELENVSELPGKYETGVMSTSNADVRVEPSAGTIAGGARATVAVMLCPKMAVDISVPIFFNIAGSPLPPLRVQLAATGQGAVVAVHPDRLDWGRLPVLSDEPRAVTLSNVSLIPARFNCSTANPDSVFVCDPADGTLAPGASCELLVHTRLDDTLRFVDELLVQADGGCTQRVALAAVGTGSTLVCSVDPGAIAFGNVFSSRECEQVVHICNQGRRAQRLVFVLDSPPPGVSGHCTIMRGGSFKKTRTPACPNPPDPSQSVFGIFPEKLTLNPGESASIAIRGLNAQAGVIVLLHVMHV